MSADQLEKGIGPEEEPEEECEYEPISLSLVDGECIILDRDRFIEELDNPMFITMRGQQIWLWWFEDGEWTYGEINAKPKAPPPKRKTDAETKVTQLRKRRDTTPDSAA